MKKSTIFVYERPEPTTERPGTRVVYNNALTEKAEAELERIERIVDGILTLSNNLSNLGYQTEKAETAWKNLADELKKSKPKPNHLNSHVICQHCNQDTGWTQESMTHLYIADDLKCPHCGEVVVFVYKTTVL